MVAVPASPRGAYFRNPLVVGPVLGAFLLFTLPMAVAYLVWPPADPAAPPRLNLLAIAFFVVFGLTHFLITFTVYLSGENLRYFASSPLRRLIYFGAPLGLLALALAADPLGRRIAPFGMAFLFAISAADFVHVARQSFGVLQIFKRESGWAAPRPSRWLENAFFLGMAALQLETLVLGGGHFPGPASPIVQLSLLAVGALGAGVLGGFALALARGGGRQGVWTALAYFAFQAGSAALAVYDYYLYLVALAMHYVEYHLIMMPRVFRSPLDGSSRADRVARALRGHRVLFYAGLLSLAVALQWGRAFGFGRPGGGGDGRLLMLSLTNGLFLFHYFIEAFIWKFSNPHYRRLLSPLYFTGPPAAPSPLTRRAS